MKIVLVPIDGSASAYRALSLALKELGDAASSQLHLLNVQPPVPAAGDSAAAQARGRAMLAQAEDMALGVHRKVQLHVRSGRAADEIVACANALGCDFILMGTRGLGAPAAATLGSVTLDVVRQSRVPVAVVR